MRRRSPSPAGWTRRSPWRATRPTPDYQEAAVQTAIQTFGSLDLLVANVGINPAYGPLMETDLEVFRKILDTNVVATLGLIQRAWRVWMAEHGGAVLIVTSVAGIRASQGIAAYGVVTGGYTSESGLTWRNLPHG